MPQMPPELRVVQGDKRPRKERKQVEEALHEMKESYLECRDLRHPWTVVGAYYVGTEVHRKLICKRCKTEATDRWTGAGERIRRTYSYKPDFRVEGGRITPVDIRREVLQRVTVWETEDELLKSLFSRRKQA